MSERKSKGQPDQVAATNAPDMLSEALQYIERGWALVPVGNDKKPIGEDGYGTRWNQPESLVRTPERACEVWGRSNYGIGVHLASSGVVSFDVDHLSLTRAALGAVGLDPERLLSAGWLITRGNRNKGRAMFRDPGGLRFRNLRVPKMTSDADNDSRAFTNIFELRAEQANLQDVLPPSIHPDGKRYSAAPLPKALPELPAELQRFWHDWDVNRDQMLRYLGVGARAREVCRGINVWDLVSLYRVSFNENITLEDVLERNGYTRKGERWKHPGSQSTAGVRPFKPGRGEHLSGPLFVSENFGCPLYNDARKPFDAFGAFVVLEHGGDVAAAERAFLEDHADIAKTVQELTSERR